MHAEPLSLRPMRSAIAPEPIDWLPWATVERSHGTYVVSRESTDGTRREFIKNSVGKTTIFRRQATAEAAMRHANGAAGWKQLGRARAVQGGAA